MSNIVNLNQQKLLKLLGVVSPNTIYTMAPKHYIVRGFDYYRKGYLLSFHWSRDFTAMKAVVTGSRHYSVIFSVNSHGLGYSCDCPAWSPSTNCKHVICAFITIKNLLHADSFRNPSQDKEQRKYLLSCLFNAGTAEKEKAGDSIYSIVFELKHNALDIYIRKGGKRLTVSSNKEPKELEPLILPPYYHFYSKIYNIRRYLKDHGNKYHLLWKSDSNECPCSFDDALNYSCETELNAHVGHVKVRKILLKNGSEFENYFLEEDLIFDLDENKVGFLKDKSGWKLWNQLNDFDGAEDDLDDDFDAMIDHYFDDEDVDFNNDDTRSGQQHSSFAIPLREFNKFQIISPSRASSESFENLILKKNGKETRTEGALQAHRITVSASKKRNDLFVLHAECNVNGSRQTPSYRLFNFFIEANYGLRGPLKTKKRRAVLHRAFFDMLSAGKKTAATKVIREALSGGDFSRPSIRREAREFLQEYLSLFLIPEVQLQLHENWTVSPVDKGRELLLYRIPYELFGWKIFADSAGHDEMFVPSRDLLEGLPLLYDKCREHGIELYFKNRPVVRSTWDFSFDATRTSGIDWFEIRPEIRCNGTAVEESLWNVILRGQSVVEKEDSIQVMDSNSRRIFNIISAMYRSGRFSETGKKEKEIVKVPRLGILDWIDLRRNGVTVKLPPEDERIMERLTRFEKIEPRSLPEKLKARLRPYQKEGYEWLSFLYEHKFGACLADDMGLGKTVQAIALLGGISEGIVSCTERDRACPHLIVVPPSLLFNWENEIRKFYPALKIYHYTGKDRDTGFGGHDIVLTTYALVRRDIEKLKGIRFNAVIFDEAQAIKNIYADTTGAVRQLTSYFKLAMTGTPLENHLGEYYSIIDLILPGLLGEYDMFRPLLKCEASPELDIIIRRTGPFVLRRTKEKILKELPRKLETDIYLELTEKQKGLYKKTVEQVRSTINDAYKSRTAAQAKIIALTAILKLRQLCLSPRLLSEDIPETSPKIEFLLNKLKELQDENHSALVFSQFTSFLDILEEDLKKTGMKFQRLDGTTPSGKRKKLVETFQSESGPSIFLLSLKAGGQGLNLTKASYVFHLDPWWNPAVENQASDRAHRIGQRKKVTVTRILTHHTIEEKMMHLKKKKLALYQAVMDGTKGGKKSQSITKDDFSFLLG